MKMVNQKPAAMGIHGILSDPRVLQTTREGELWYSAPGIVQVLTESEYAQDLWQDLKAREPRLETMAQAVEFTAEDPPFSITLDALDIQGVLRLVQSISSPRAERIKQWLIESAQQRIEEIENPELALLRARRLYEHRGYSRRWIDKRLRGVGARHELTSEWSHRGARDSEDYRALTNELIKSSFGMNVETYRKFKGLAGRNDNLRDHLTDLELSLVTLVETLAAELHRDRGSEGLDKLLPDTREAGQIVAQAISQIERRTGKPVATSPHHAVGTPNEKVAACA